MFGGDIIKVHYTDIMGIEHEAIGVIQMGELFWEIDFPHLGTTVAMFEFWTDKPEDFEIIGNERDNPEILEKLLIQESKNAEKKS